jgi:hypothetical protein
MAQWEGQLVRRGAVQEGLCHHGKGAVDCFPLGVHHRLANVLPRAAQGQARSARLEAAMKDEPVVLVHQG